MHDIRTIPSTLERVSPFMDSTRREAIGEAIEARQRLIAENLRISLGFRGLSNIEIERLLVEVGFTPSQCDQGHSLLPTGEHFAPAEELEHIPPSTAEVDIAQVNESIKTLAHQLGMIRVALRDHNIAVDVPEPHKF